MKQTTIPAIRKAAKKIKRAMIGNLFFGPVEAKPLKSTASRIYFERVDNGEHISFARANIGESVFVEYFIP